MILVGPLMPPVGAFVAHIRGGTTQHFTFDLSPGPSGVAFWAGMHIGGTNPAALSWEYHRT